MTQGLLLDQSNIVQTDGSDPKDLGDHQDSLRILAETLPIKASDDRGVVRMRVAWGVFPGQACAPEPALAQELNERQ